MGRIGNEVSNVQKNTAPFVVQQKLRNTVKRRVISNDFFVKNVTELFFGEGLTIKSDNLDTGLNFGSKKVIQFDSCTKYLGLVHQL